MFVVAVECYCGSSAAHVRPSYFNQETKRDPAQPGAHQLAQYPRHLRWRNPALDPACSCRASLR